MKTKVKNKRNLLYVSLNVLLGNLMMAFAYSVFVIPNNIPCGGTGGIGIVLQGFFDIDPTHILTILTWALFFLGLITLGKEFALKTLPCTVLYPVFTYMFNSIGPLQEAAYALNSPLLAALFAGALYGVSSGLIFKVGGSSGGVDIPALLISKKTHMSVEKVIFLGDLFFIILGIFTIGFTNSLLAVLLCFISMEAIDRVTFGGSSTMLIYIISEHHMEEINDHILTKFERGTTIIPSIGGYTNSPKKMIQAVISRSEYIDIEDFVNKCDPNAFVIVINAKDTFGEGFKRSKYLNK